jgi:hypothetical protein
LSRIVDGYDKDFERGGRSFLGCTGFKGVPELVADYAARLIDSEVERGRLPAGGVAVRFLDYDWSLNDTPRATRTTRTKRTTHDRRRCSWPSSCPFSTKRH